MKKFFSYFMVFMCLLGTSVVTSCSSSDDDKKDELPELPYLSDAAIYQLDEENNNEEIVYIELTTAGNYFIQYVGGAPENSPVAMKRFECSTFTKKSDGTYQLNGKNVTLKIESAGGNKYNITLGDKTYTATKAGTGKASFADANNICRSWRVKKAYAEIKELTMPEPLKVSASNYKELTNKLTEQKRVLPYFVELDYISFSNTKKDSNHLWYVGKTDSSISRGVWQWKSSPEGGLVNFDDAKDENSGVEQNIDVTFVGSTMKLSHTTANGSTTITWEYELTPAPVKVK
jgi:hypothetical protein